MRSPLPALSLCLALLPSFALGQNADAADWHLLAIDGQVVDVRATLTYASDGTVSGQAPCNRWSATNAAKPPALSFGAIRATRMACDRMADEKTFFDTLALMNRLQPDGDSTLVLTGPDGRSMEFVACKTCKPQ